MKDNKSELYDKLEETLRGECAAGYITKDDVRDILADFETWYKTANIGDIYFYSSCAYILKSI